MAREINALFSPALFALLEDRYGTAASARVAAWQRLILKMSAATSGRDLDKSHLANDFFNRLPWLTDTEHWGVEDYWATPVETLASNGGDCEDFSIAKYFTLSASGVGESKLRITYVKALDYNQAHMVLAYYSSPGAEPLILDNINRTILPSSQRPDLLPVYSFNAEGLWLAKSRMNNLREGGSGLPQWREMAERMRREGQLP